MSNNRFEPFDRVDLRFRTINEHPLQATVLTPKSLQSKPSAQYPVLVHWHGGGFVVGHRMYEGWFALWLLEFALSKNAIIISPDYRLMPEANGIDIMSDVECFWTWLHGTLPSISQSWHSRPDLSKIACCGESAGGYLSVQSALMFPHSNIKVMISIAGPLNADVPHFKVPRPRTLMGSRPPPPRQAEATIRDYLKNMKPGAIRTGCEPSEMWELAMCVFQQAYLPRFFGVKGNPVLDLMATLDRVKTMPPIWVIHGEQDTMSPPICSTGFVSKLKEVLPDVPVLLTLQPGDHGFDVLNTMEVEWVQKGCTFVEKYWP